MVPTYSSVRGYHSRRSEFDAQPVRRRCRLAAQDVAVGDVVFIERARIAHLDGTLGESASARTAFAFQAGVRGVESGGEHNVDEVAPAWPAQCVGFAVEFDVDGRGVGSSSAVGASCAMSANGSPDNDEYTSEWTS